jgi:hypothetical protein
MHRTLLLSIVLLTQVLAVNIAGQAPTNPSLTPNGVETFEAQTLGATPTGAFYTAVSSVTVIATTGASGNRAVTVADGLGGFQTPANMCLNPAAKVSFAFRFPAFTFGGSGNVARFGIGGTQAGIQVDGAGAVSSYSKIGSITNTASIPGITVAAGTWIHLSLSKIDCTGAGNYLIEFPDQGITAIQSNSAFSGSGITTVGTLVSASGTGGGISGLQLDDLTLTGFTTTACCPNHGSTETFDADTLFGAPTGPYTLDSASSNFVTNNAACHVQCFVATSKYSLDFTTTFCNSQQSITFQVRLTALPTSTTEIYAGISSVTGGISGANTAAPGQWLGIRFGSDGKVRAVDTATSQTNEILFAQAYNANTWYEVHVGNLRCELANSSNSGVRSSADVTFNGETKTVTASAAFTNAATAFHYFAVGNAQTTPAPVQHYLDDLSFRTTQINGAVFADVTGLVGFDADATGQTVIARTDGGSRIHVYDANTLVANSNSIDTHCNRVDGVAALSSHVSFFQCNTAGLVTTMSLRSNNLGDPNFGSICTSGDFCYQDIDTQSSFGSSALAGDQTNQYQIMQIEAFPFDFSIGSLHGVNVVTVGWAFTDSTGAVGVVLYNYVNNELDDSDFVTTVLDASGHIPDQICTVRDINPAPNGDGNAGTADVHDYLYAASTSGTAKGYEIQYDLKFGINNEYKPTSLTTVFPGTSQTVHPLGIACGDNRFAVLTSSKLLVYNRGSSTASVTVSISGTVPPRGLAMSRDGKWITYVADTNWHVINAATGNETGTGPIPAGTFHSMRMQGAASRLLIGTTQKIGGYPIYPITTGTEQTFDDRDYGLNRSLAGGAAGAQGGGISGSKGEQFIWFLVSTALASLAGWFLTGGNVTDGKVAPGNPAIIGILGYLGMWAGVIYWAPFYWWIPTLLPIGGLAFMLFAPKVRGS